MFQCLEPFLNEMVGASTSRGWSMRKRDQKRIATCLQSMSNVAWLAVSMVKTNTAQLRLVRQRTLVEKCPKSYFVILESASGAA